MSDNLEQEDVSSARRGRRPSTIQELFDVEQETRVKGDVVLRKIATSTSFERTVTCRPGMITVLPKGQRQNYDSFRAALLGRDTQNEISMRLGKHELHSSEIFTVVPSNVLDSGARVAEVLRLAGVSENDLNDVAKAIGVERNLNELTQNLPNKVVARLSAAIAVWSRSRIIYLDSPFNQVGSEWAPAIAHMLLQSVVDSDRVMIVGGVEKLPRIWKASPCVEVAGVEVGVYDGDVQVVDETMGYLRKIQHLIGTNGTDESSDITTYPQRIFRRRTPSDSAMCIETICNPNLTKSEQSLYSVQPETISKPTAAKSRKRRPTSGSLTRVTKLRKLRNKSMVMALQTVMVRNQTRLREDPGLAHYRIQRAEEKSQRRQQLELMLLILILLMTVLLLLNWL